MQKFLDSINGAKTYIGIVVTIFGMTGAVRFITPDQLTEVLSKTLDVIGIVITVIGAVHKDFKIDEAKK